MTLCRRNGRLPCFYSEHGVVIPAQITSQVKLISFSNKINFIVFPQNSLLIMFYTIPVDITLIWRYVGGGGQSSGASGQLTQEHVVLKHVVFTLHLHVKNFLKPEEKSHLCLF